MDKKEYDKLNKMSRKLSPEQIKEICNLYLNSSHCTHQMLAEKYHVCTGTIYTILKKCGVKKDFIRLKDFDLIENYFEIINTPMKSYLLGFLFADGNVFGNQIALEIQTRDVEILHLLQKELNSVNKISHRKRPNTEVSTARVNSIKMTQDLAKYGIVPNKTYVTKHLPNIPKEFERDFLRGLLDGDGWITKRKDGSLIVGFVTYSPTICQEFLDRCNELIEHKNISQVTNKGKGNSGFVAQFQQKNCVKDILTVLYKDSVCSLSRKYNLAALVFDDEDIV